MYHLGAYAAEGLSLYIRHFNYETNLLGSINLINQSVLGKVDCFVFIPLRSPCMEQTRLR